MHLIYSITCPHTFSWTSDYLPALQDAGLSFDTVGPKVWLQRHRSLATNSPSTPNLAASNTEANTVLKLVRIRVLQGSRY